MSHNFECDTFTVGQFVMVAFVVVVVVVVVQLRCIRISILNFITLGTFRRLN